MPPKPVLLILSVMLMLVAAVPGGRAHAAPTRVDAVQVELVANRRAITPGETFQLGLHLIHDEGWHTYWRNPGDSGLPTQFPLSLPPGFQAKDIIWPLPERFLIPPLANLGYDGEVTLVREVRAPADLGSGEVEFSTLAQWLVCSDVCVPGEAKLTLRLRVDTAGADDPRHQPGFDRTNQPQPEQAMPVALTQDSLRILVADALVGERTAPPRLEFFPFAEGVVRYADPQRLYRIADRQAWVLEMPLDTGASTGGSAAAPAPDPDSRRTDGLLVIDATRGLTVRSVRAGSADFAGLGAPVAQIEGELVPVFARQPPAGTGLLEAGRNSAGGLLDRLTGPGGAGQANPSGATDAGSRASGPPAMNAAGVAGAASGAVAPTLDNASAISGSLLLALLFAAVGGLILNLMPCVFPVIGLKILGFAGAGGGGAILTDQTRKAIRRGSFWFAAGVIVSFLILAAVLLTLRAAGESIGWGFQLQSPLFVMLMAMLFVAIGLNLSGVYEFGLVFTRLGNLEAPTAEAGGAQSGLHSFGSGVLAVLVATPCTAPFMGSALGYTLAQPAINTLSVFLALGVGMALPYLALGLMPQWLRWLPRPGPWMETLRQFMAFPMYAAAIWLAWVLGRQAGLDAMLALALGTVVFALGLWIWGRLVQQNRGGSRPVWAATGALALVAAFLLAWPSGDPQAGTETAPKGWVDWAPGAVERELAAGRPVFLDFTAAWCISCQVNERMVLASDAVQAAFREAGVVAMRADWTQRDPAITAELARLGRNSVPVYLVYRPGGGAPTMLPEILTQAIVLQALR